MTKNGDVHLRITFAKSEQFAVAHQMAIYHTMQMRTRNDIRKR